MSNYYEYKNAEGERLNIHYVTIQNDIMYAIPTTGEPMLWDELIKNYQPVCENKFPPMVTDGMPISIPCCSIHTVEGLEDELDKISGRPNDDDFIERRKVLYDHIHPLVEKLRTFKKLS